MPETTEVINLEDAPSYFLQRQHQVERSTWVCKGV